MAGGGKDSVVELGGGWKRIGFRYNRGQDKRINRRKGRGEVVVYIC